MNELLHLESWRQLCRRSHGKSRGLLLPFLHKWSKAGQANSELHKSIMMALIQNSSIYTDQCWPTAFSLLLKSHKAFVTTHSRTMVPLQILYTYKKPSCDNWFLNWHKRYVSCQECHTECRYTIGIGHMCISLSDTFRYARLRCPLHCHFCHMWVTLCEHLIMIAIMPQLHVWWTERGSSLWSKSCPPERLVLPTARELQLRTDCTVLWQCEVKVHGQVTWLLFWMWVGLASTVYCSNKKPAWVSA